MPQPPPQKNSSEPIAAFTILETLVSVAILAIVLVVVFSAMTHSSAVWQRAGDKVEVFQSARASFDQLTRNLSQATLNTYLDYDNAAQPTNYIRKSELAFVCGTAGSAGFPGVAGTGQAVFFQAPLGYSTNKVSHGNQHSLMNACGYYVTFNTNTSIPSHVQSPSNPYRFRLMQLLVPSENNAIYTSAGNGWFTAFTNRAQPLADNIIALIIRPQDPGAAPGSQELSSDYTYDSTRDANASPQPITANQMPPVLKVTMVAIDEASAKRLGNDLSGTITEALGEKFQTPADYTKSLSDLEAALNNKRIGYRVFSAAVPIRESKWTK